MKKVHERTLEDRMVQASQESLRQDYEHTNRKKNELKQAIFDNMAHNHLKKAQSHAELKKEKEDYTRNSDTMSRQQFQREQAYKDVANQARNVSNLLTFSLFSRRISSLRPSKINFHREF